MYMFGLKPTVMRRVHSLLTIATLGIPNPNKRGWGLNVFVRKIVETRRCIAVASSDISPRIF